MEKPKASIGTSADLEAGVHIGEVHGGYFSNKEHAEVFAKIGIGTILKDLPKEIVFMDFGGGEGFLTNHVKDYLVSKGHSVNASVLDANPQYLEIAKPSGLSTIFSSIQKSNIKQVDLIIARALIHYNSVEKQQVIFNKIFDSLKEGGYFVHQNSSGSEENCKLRSDIVNLKSLGRAIGDFKYKWLSEEACLRMLKKAGFKKSFIEGYAPSNSWSPQEQWKRFNKKITNEAKQSGNKKLLEEVEKRKNIYLREANSLIEKYLAKYNNKNNDIKKIDNNNYLIEYTYPISISRK